MATGGSFRHLECPICYELLADPIALICGHSICRICLRTLVIRNGKDNVKCPMCNKENILYLIEDVDKMCTNYLIKEMVERRKEELKVGNKSESPSFDEEKEVADELDITKVNIEKENEIDHKNVQEQRKNDAHEHVVHSNRKHDNDKESEKQKVAQLLCQECNNDKDIIACDHCNHELCVDCKKKHFEKFCTELANQIRDYTPKVRIFYKKISSEISALKKTDKEIIRGKEVKKETARDILSKMISTLQDLNKYKTKANATYQKAKDFEDTFQKLKKIFDALLSQDVTTPSRNLPPQYDYKRMMMDEIVQLDSDPWQLDFYDEKFIIAMRGKNSIDTLQNGKLVKSLKFYKSLSKIAYLNEPHGLYKMVDGYFAIADTLNHRILKSAANGEIAQSTNTDCDFNMPWRISQCESNQNLYITASLNARIKVLNSDLKFIQNIQSEVLNQPYGIKISKNNRLLITDNDNRQLNGNTCIGKIHEFTLTGKHVKTITIPNAFGHRASLPVAGVAVDSSGFVLICVKSPIACIRVLNPDLTRYVSFGKNDLKMPEDVCILPDGRVAVSDSFRLITFKSPITNTPLA